MKLSLLYEANFIPKQEPKISVRQSLGSEASKMSEYPKRSGNTELTTGDPKKDKIMGVQNPHATRASKIGRPQSDGGRPKRLGGQKGTSRRQENATGSDAEPESTIPAEDNDGADADDYPVDEDPRSMRIGRMGEKKPSQQSNIPPSQTSINRLWGNRYPGRKV